MTRTNPLKSDALTADTVAVGNHIIVWIPDVAGSTKFYQVLNGPYTDDDGTMVIDVRDAESKEYTLPTSEAGLTGGRYDGEWTHIAIIDDREE